MTPPPEGKKPFFLSHYGCQGSYFLDQQEDYDAPYYHWKDFRKYYLDKLDKYDERRKKLSDK